ncbi:MAG: hypothetical protein KAS04_03575 [Candidatus Aenigmarchaeota archaeon]|nr:hypothetical protein [Candidatus Aenigmarchaeota archaeon]
MSKRFRVNRSQLAKFISDHETIKEFEKLFESDSDISTIVDNILEAVGLEVDGKYLPDTETHYIFDATSLKNADSKLDEVIWDNIREAITSISGDTSLTTLSQTVLCNAASGEIDVTMPPPADCFENNRSLRFAIHKIDTSSNIVTILPNASELIVGESYQTLEMGGEILNFITDGTNWYLGA